MKYVLGAAGLGLGLGVGFALGRSLKAPQCPTGEAYNFHTHVYNPPAEDYVTFTETAAERIRKMGLLD
jgi:hypothetical protein